jgi:hypothetical protein
MNTNEIQQVMENNEQYMSLYEYKGHGSRQSGLGKQVNSAAKAAGIKIIYRPLPEHLVQKEYKSVATYPVSFLDKYFDYFDAPATTSTDQTKPIDSDFVNLLDRVEKLEQKLTKLLTMNNNYVTNSNEYDDDDLPF